MLDLDFSTYEQIVADYRRMKDNDFNEAYRLKTEASAELEYIESKMVEYMILSLELEREAKALEAQTSYEANKKSVADGNRQASKDAVVLDAWKQNTIAKKCYELLKVKVNMLLRVYYDSKEMLEKANRKYREGRD